MVTGSGDTVFAAGAGASIVVAVGYAVGAGVLVGASVGVLLIVFILFVSLQAVMESSIVPVSKSANSFFFMVESSFLVCVVCFH